MKKADQTLLIFVGLSYLYSANFKDMTNIEEIIWSKAPGYNRYLVSNTGTVKSISRTVRCKSGYFRTTKEKLMKPTINIFGYPTLKLFPDGCNRRSRTAFIHRIVLLAFVENKNNYPCVNHKNGIKTDNRLENLEWCSYSQNSKHAIETGLQKIKYGSETYISKLTNEQVKDIRLSDLSTKMLSKKYNVSISAIRNVIHRIHYKNIP